MSGKRKSSIDDNYAADMALLAPVVVRRRWKPWNGARVSSEETREGVRYDFAAMDKRRKAKRKAAGPGG